MCLIYSEETTNRLRSAMEDAGGSLTMWKRLGWDGRCLCAPHYSMAYKAGENVARGAGGALMEKPGDRIERHVEFGIHVYLNRSDAEAACFWDEEVVPVTCRVEELIAAGLNNGDDDGAVFSRVTIGQAEYDDAVRRRSLFADDDYDDDDDDYFEDLDDDN